MRHNGKTLDHPPPDRLELLVRGLLNDSEAAPLREHLKRCTTCRELYNEWRADEVFVPLLRESLRAEGESSEGNATRGEHQELSASGDTSHPELDGISILGYVLESELPRGRGGQGIVYKAIQEGTQRVVALKILRGGRFASEASRRRFEREIGLAAGLAHPNIVTIYESGQRGGQYYYAMEYVEGQPLDEYVAEREMSVRNKLELFLDITRAISHAHLRGVIHRDLKPSNILVDETDKPRVLDFGLAREVDQSDCPTLSHEGQFLGTLAYMSPEQTRGNPGDIDTRTDVYSLGIIFYTLLTGRAPYETDLRELELREAIRNIQEFDPPRPSKVRKELNFDVDAVVLRAMQKETHRRYQTAEQLADDLQALLEGRPVTARSDSSFYVLRKLAARHYFHTSVIILLGMSILGFGSISFHAFLREREAVEKVRKIDQAFVSHSEEQQELGERAQAHLGEQVLGWFLLEWHANRLEAAHSIQQHLRPGSPERYASQYLLADTMTFREFQQGMPPGSESLILFISGEKSFKKGDVQAARVSFDHYCRRYTDMWTPLARARLKEIAERRPAVSTAAPF